MKLLRVKEVAEQLSLSVDQVYDIKGKINYVKLGGAVRFRQQDVDRFISDNLLGPREMPVVVRKYKCLSN
jgi:excisionase family DNA binding protein